MSALWKYIDYVPFLVAGLFWGLFATPVVGWVAKKFGFVDLPPEKRKIHDETKDRRTHTKAMPRLGGLVLIAPAIIAPLLFGSADWIIGLSVGVVILGIVGVLDDRYELMPKVPTIALVVTGVTALLFGIYVKEIGNPFDGDLSLQFGKMAFSLFGRSYTWYILAVLISLAWMLVLPNALNWADNTGGITAGICGLAMMVMMLIGIREQNHEVAALSAIVLGAILGFLPFNVIPEKIFISSTSLALGYMVAVLSIVGQAKISTMFLVLGLPVIDFVVVIVGRLSRRKPKSLAAFIKAVTTGDKTHLAHKLQDAGLERRQVFWAEIGLTFILALFALAVSGLMLTVMVVGVCGIIILGYLSISRVIQRRKAQTEPDHKSPEEKFAY